MTFHRLLFREIAVPLLLALVLIGQLLVVMQMLVLNDVLFGAGFDPWGVVRTAVYLLPHLGIIAVPLSLLLAVMLGVGRLVEDNELVAFTALGRSPLELYAVPALVSVVLGALVGVLAFVGEPWGLRGIRLQLNDLIKRNVAGDIRAGTFFEDVPRFTVYVDETEPDSAEWRRVLLHDSVGDGVPFFVTARQGRVESEGTDEVLRLELDDGELHRADTEASYTRAAFEKASFALGVSDFLRGRNKFRRPANELRFSQMDEAAAEARAAGELNLARRIEVTKHSRVAACFTCLLFALVAVPLAVRRKGSRGQSFVATVLAFAAYYVLRAATNGLGENGHLSPLVAAWIPNLVGVVVVVLLAGRVVKGSVAGARR